MLHGGVAHRRDLRAVGVTRADVRTEVQAGRWVTAGVHTVCIGTEPPRGEATWWQALWECGSGGVLDGVCARLAAGLKGFTADRIDVAIPANNRSRARPGVTLHRRRAIGPTVGAGVARTTLCVRIG